MEFHSADEALQAIVDMTLSPDVHQEAIRYLSGLDDEFETEKLIHALQSDNPGVRWEAGNLLARFGRKSIPMVLKALTDPQRVGDIRLREGVIHMIHKIQDAHLQHELKPLIDAMHSLAVSVNTMRIADQMLRNIDPDRSSAAKDEAQ
jgi:HEAT repeat protein